MWYIIGLGNIGEQYKNTRHNIAWIVFDTLFSAEWNYNKYMNAEVSVSGEVMYIKPHTYMNNSGEVVSFLKKDDAFDAERLVVVYDDLDLPFGQMKISYDRGDGGHKGVQSIVQHLGTQAYIRIRLGISRRGEQGELIKPNVLGNFNEEELSIIHNDMTPQIQKVIHSLKNVGLEKTMNVFNTKQ